MTPVQRAAWLAERRTGVGGSDAAAAVGLSKWRTRLELFLDKRGEMESTESEPMFWGTALEPVVRQVAADRLGLEIEIPNRILRHPKVQFAIATVDGIGFSPSGQKRLYEGKTARTSEGWGEAGSADIPQEYLLQVQHCLFVTGLDVCDVAVLIGGSDFRTYEVPADRDLQQMLIDQEAEFWAMVQNNTPPEPVSAEDVKRRWRISTGKQFLAGKPEADKALLLRRAKDMAKFLDAKIEEFTTDLQAQMKDCGELIGPDGETLATWNNIKTSPRFDLERFKAEQPDLYASYLKDSGHQRRFLLKVKGTELCLPVQLTNLLDSSSATEKVEEALPPPPPSAPATSSESPPSSSEPSPKSKRPSRSRKPAPATKSPPSIESKPVASESASPNAPNTSTTVAGKKSRARRSTSSRSSQTTGATSNSASVS